MFKHIKTSKKEQKRYIAVLLVHDSDNTYNIVKFKEFNPISDKVDFKFDDKDIDVRPFAIDISYPSFTYNNIHYYCIEKNGFQLLFSDSEKNIIDSEVLDDILNKNIIRQLAKATQSKKTDWFTLLTVLSVGGLIGFIIGQYIKVG